MKAALLRLAQAQTAHLAEEDRRRAVITNIAAYLVAGLVLVFGLCFALLTTRDWRPVLACNLALALAGLVTPALHRFGPVAAPVWLAAAAGLQVGVLAWILGSQSGILLNLLAIPTLTVLTLGPQRLRLAGAISAITLVVILAGTLGFDRLPVSAWKEGAAAVHVFVVAIFTAAFIPLAAVFYAMTATERAERARRALLLAIMPATVVDRLLARPGETLVQEVGQASVLFADLAGFTALAARIGSAASVQMLDRLYAAFDRQAADCGVEKIKTIGDAFLAAAGLPAEVPDPEVRLLRLGLALQREAGELGRDLGLTLDLRIGMAAGPLTAVVIGTARYSYDIWGDTVNRASRLTALAQRGEILLDRAMADALAPRWPCRLRSRETLKGLGEVEVWQLEGADQPAA